MKAESRKRRTVYLFFSVIGLLLLNNYYLNCKYDSKTKTSTESLEKINQATNSEKNPAVSPKATAKKITLPGVGKEGTVSRPNAVPIVGQKANKAMSLTGGEGTLPVARKMTASKVKAAKPEPGLKGALVIYNRLPENIKLEVLQPDGKKIEKVVRTLKSVQIDVPMGIYSIKASDSNNKMISSGQVTVHDELGAAYYVKL